MYIMDELLQECIHIEEKLLIRQFVKNPEDPNKWTKAQLEQAISLLRKYVDMESDPKLDIYNLIELHKKLLPVDPEACLEIGEMLLETVSSPIAQLNKRIDVYRNNCYAYLWNYMRAEIKQGRHSFNLNLCFLALRFSLVHTILNLNQVVSKLQQCIQVTQKILDEKVLAKAWLKLIDTIKDSLSREFGDKNMTEAQLKQMEESIVQLLLTIPRHIPIHSICIIRELCQSIQSAAQNYIPMMKLDLAATHISKSDSENSFLTLANLLYKHPSILDSWSGIYDVFEYKTPWKNWSDQWVALKKDNRELEMTSVFDILKKDEMDEEYKLFLSKALRFEINAYFSPKMILPDGIITAGQALLTCATDYIDVGLGNLAQGIGFYFGGEEHENDAVELCLEAVKMLNKGAMILKDNPATLLVAAVSYAWVGLSKLRCMQTRSSNDLKGFKVHDMATNPSRYKGLEDDDGSRIISGISTVTMKEEFEVGTWLNKSVDVMFKLTKAKDEIKGWIKGICPSMFVVTMRLVAHTLTTLGDLTNSIKAWHIVYILTSHFENTLAHIFSGAELIKQIPHLDPRLVNEIEETFLEVWDRDESILKSTRPYLWRLQIAKSTMALHNKDYQNGLSHLLPLLKFRLEKDNYDISHHVMGEVYFLLSQYRALDVSLKIDFSGIPDCLSEMSPVCLATKAFKHLAGMARAPSYRQSGWADILHNSFLLASMMQMAMGVSEVLKSSGKIRELRIFAADVVYLAQQLGLVTRTIQLVLILAEADMLAKAFDSCELKILGLTQTLKEKIEVKDSGPPLLKKHIIETLRKCGISCDHKKLINIPDIVFIVKSINMPEYHYSKGDRNEEKADSTSPIIHKFRTPSFLFHSLKCKCYVCYHPLIVPLTVQYLQLLASYAIHSGNSTSMDLIQAASKQHLRGMFRILHNFETYMKDLSDIFTPKGAKNALERIYVPFFYEPVVKSLLIQMELVSHTKIDFIIDAHKMYTEACNLYDPKDAITKHKSFEILASALFLFLFDSNHFEIKGSKVKEMLKTAVNKNPIFFDDAHSPELPIENLTEKVCAGPTKKGVRNKTKKVE